MGIRQHLSITIRSCYPQPGGSAAFRVAEISDVQWAIGPLQPSDPLSADHDSPDGELCSFVQDIPV